MHLDTLRISPARSSAYGRLRLGQSSKGSARPLLFLPGLQAPVGGGGLLRVHQRRQQDHWPQSSIVSQGEFSWVSWPHQIFGLISWIFLSSFFRINRK